MMYIVKTFVHVTRTKKCAKSSVNRLRYRSYCPCPGEIVFTFFFANTVKNKNVQQNKIYKKVIMAFMVNLPLIRLLPMNFFAHKINMATDSLIFIHYLSFVYCVFAETIIERYNKTTFKR